MKMYSGTIRFSPLEGGFWQLESDDGQIYQLTGKLKGLKEGKNASIEGEIRPNRFSFAMTGPILFVNKLVLKD